MGRGIARTLAALALALAGLTASVAASASTAPGTSAPTVSAATPAADELDGIWCASQKSCLAVGQNLKATFTTPLAETWNGSTWKKAALTVPTGSLYRLSCLSAKHCVAVGQDLNDHALAYTWTGSVWKAATPPGPVGPGTYLIGVSCRSATSCVAVGSEQGSKASVAYSDILSGTTWVGKAVPVPKGAFISQLEDVSCAAATFCVATGYSAPGEGPVSAFIDRWNGKVWSAMKPAKLPAGFRVQLLNGVSCVSPRSCVAVGNVGKPGELLAVSETWNGKTWSYTKVSWPKGVKNAELNEVRCLSASHCVAVGLTGQNPASTYLTGRAAAVVWNGKAWKAQSVPAPARGKFSVFYGLYCTKAFCAAAGQTGPSGSPNGTGLAGFTTGSSWKVLAAK